MLQNWVVIGHGIPRPRWPGWTSHGDHASGNVSGNQRPRSHYCSATYCDSAEDDGSKADQRVALDDDRLRGLTTLSEYGLVWIISLMIAAHERHIAGNQYIVTNNGICFAVEVA